MKPGASATGLKRALRIFVDERKECAVCIPDGAVLVLNGISPKLQKAHRLRSTERVTFRQLSADYQTFRDAIEFCNGVKIRLQNLEEGQIVEVLTLASRERRVHERASISAHEELGVIK